MTRENNENKEVCPCYNCDKRDIHGTDGIIGCLKWLNWKMKGGDEK